MSTAALHDIEYERQMLEHERPQPCEHEHTQPRWRTRKNGLRLVVIQCVICGKERSTPRQFGPVILQADKNADFDETLADRWDDEQKRAWKDWSSRWQEIQTAERDIRSDIWWANHNTYLQTETWRQKRALCLARDQYLCQARLPGCTKHAVQAHHLTYEHHKNEPLFDLISVCVSCHDQITEMDREGRQR